MKLPVRSITKIAILSTLAFILMLFELPLPFMPPFLKIDVSEIPVLLATFALGPFSAVLVELLKNGLHLFRTSTMGVGELANFLVGAAFVVPVGIIYKMHKNRKGAFIGLAAGTLSMVVFASLFNYFALLPLYAKVLYFPTDAVIAMGTEVNKYVVDVKTFIAYAIVPFNLIKGIVLSLLTLIIYKKLSPILHK